MVSKQVLLNFPCFLLSYYYCIKIVDRSYGDFERQKGNNECLIKPCFLQHLFRVIPVASVCWACIECLINSNQNNANIPVHVIFLQNTELTVTMGCAQRVLILFVISGILHIPCSIQYPEDQEFGGDGFYTRTKELQTMRNEELVIQIKSMRDFNEYLVRGRRNYSVVALLNKSNKKNCYPCTYAEDVMMYLASAYEDQYLRLEGQSRQPLFFVEILNEHFSYLFRKLEVKNIPSLLFFPPDGMLSNLERFESEWDLFDVVRIRDFISGATRQQVVLDAGDVYGDERENKSSIVGPKAWLCIILAVSTVVFLALNKLKSLFGKFWNAGLTAYGIMTLVIILIGGHIFNHIEKPEYGSAGGLDSIFHSSFDYQFQIEAYAISFIYFGVAFAFLQLVEGRRQILTKTKGGTMRSVVAVILATGMFYLLYRVLVIKNPYSE
ncbi:unnamed protein product [Allacma fusca]|uniref:Uncharacterized protein n=1 Tax=Allacma fusca TaxID=39272 RepID=A0A8J2KQU8_9HEXA|nr:unnamed protein product [Allacma fusca]